MAEKISFKVWLRNSDKNTDSDVRRFAMDQELSRSFSSLSEKLCSVYPSLNNKMFAVTWTDDDNDSVTISTDDELSIALAEMAGPIHKLQVQVKGDKENGKKNTEGDVHPGVMCDGCEKAVSGFRYKCLVCPDFDLCGVCENAGLHPEHNMMRIARPDQKSVPNMGKQFHRGQRNNCRRPCHGPMPGVFGFLEGLERIAGNQGKEGTKSAENKTAAKEEEKQTETSEEVRKESEEKNQDNKENKEKSTEEMITNFLGAAVGCLGEDVKVPSKDIENVGKLVSNIVSMFNIDIDTQEKKNESEDETKEQKLPTEERNDVKPEKEKETTSNEDEQWTIVKDESQDKSPSTNMYPSLDEVAPPPSSDASISPSTGSPSTNSSIPSAPANVTDPKILVALQAMANMGFNNEGGWLKNLLETKEGDIGKVLDVLKPTNNK